MTTDDGQRTAAIQELFLEVLRSSGQAKLAVTGTSMLSSIWPGDILEVRRESVAAISPGEVVLYARNGGLAAHRVIEKAGRPERPLLITRGDRLSVTDAPVSPEELLGRVTAIVRRGRRMDPRLTLGDRVASWVLSRSELFTRLAVRLRNRL